MSNWIVEITLVALLIGWVIYTHRPTQQYKSTIWLDAPLDEAKELFCISPDSRFTYPVVSDISWMDRGKGIFRATYAGKSLETHCRIPENTDVDTVITDGAYFDPVTYAYFDKFLTKSTFRPHDGGTAIETEINYDRGALWPVRPMRLFYPIAHRSAREMLYSALADDRAKRGLPPPRKDPAEHADKGIFTRVGGWPMALNIASIIWFIVDLGLWPGLVLIATIVIHEGGHLWSMRRHGHHMARAMLIPFFGGVAYSSTPMQSDAADAEVTLMGPAAGLALALALFFVGQAWNNGWVIAASGMVTIVNGFNLAPIPPLDGGQIVQLLVRRLGERILFALSMILVAVGLLAAFWLKSVILTVLLVLNGALLAFAKSKKVERPALSNPELGIAIISYGGLIWLHVWLLLKIAGNESIFAFWDALERSPF